LPKFITVTALRAHAGELANRDDTGSAKTLMFGGVSRTRISSQAQKRRLRMSTSKHALDSVLPDGTRSRLIFSHDIMDRLVGRGVPEEAALQLVGALKGIVLKSKD
jgi:CRISPR system Cascade subunit CasC